MRKILLSLLLCFIFYNGLAQDPALFQTWYLSAYNQVPNHIYVTDITPYINPSMVITSNLDFSGEAACNSFNGNFIYDSNNDSLYLNTVSSTTNNCGIQEQIDFEAYFFNVISEGNNWQFELSFDNTNLTINDSNGKTLYFKNSPIQNPELSQTWYFNSIYYEFDPEINIADINPPISPTLTVDGLNFSGEAACNTYSGTFSLSGIGHYVVDTFTKTNNVCDYQSHTDFEVTYLGSFSEGNIYDPVVSNGPFDVQYLELSNPLFWGLKFSNNPFPVPDLFNNWYLWSINYDSGDVIEISTIDPPIVPNLSIYPDLDIEGVGDCNSFSGDFEYDAVNETLTTFNYSETLLICDEETIEADYFAFFSSGEPLIYSIHIFDPNQLTISSPLFNYNLVFNKNPILSIPSFDKLEVVIYPNPVSNTLNISSENSVIDSITIYSSTGKKVLENFKIENSIDVSNLSNGMYFIEISSGPKKSVKKFIKK